MQTLCTNFDWINNGIKIPYDGSIDSWRDLCEAFTTQKRQPTTMVMHNGITQGKKRNYMQYINRFTMVVMVVGGFNESLKWLIF